jgi:hypothetical protein
MYQNSVCICRLSSPLRLPLVLRPPLVAEPHATSLLVVLTLGIVYRVLPVSVFGNGIRYELILGHPVTLRRMAYEQSSNQ